LATNGGDRAISTGLIAIGNHSWDHLYPALSEVAHSQQARGDFRQVTNVEDADRQIYQAAQYIAERTHRRAAPFFAYPFGHYNDFLTREYLPEASRSAKLDLRAAFTADPIPLTGHANMWALPRYVCGHDWKSPADLLGILIELIEMDAASLQRIIEVCVFE
jgi:peptidoglycan/xylan/chitin deacetylase (PgdA/CDA1 family)